MTTLWSAWTRKVGGFYDAEIEKRQHLVAKAKGFHHCRPFAVDLRQLHQRQVPEPLVQTGAAFKRSIFFLYPVLPPRLNPLTLQSRSMTRVCRVHTHARLSAT
jgi:hypothetical protein